MTALSTRLGYPDDQPLVIVNADDLGSTLAVNDAIFAALAAGHATSATLMVPAPWAADAAERYSDEDIGVHLTLTSEWTNYRWGPVTAAPSLCDADGRFPQRPEQVWARASLDEVRAECRAQVEQALRWGVDVTHLDAHMGVMQLDQRFLDIYVELAAEFQLPLRMGGPRVEQHYGLRGRELADAKGVLYPDQFLFNPVGSRPAVTAAISALRPGMTEFLAHPAVDGPDLCRAYPDWAERVDDLAFLAELPALIAAKGARMIGYRELRDLQRGRSTGG